MGRMSERNKNFTDDWTQTVWQKIVSKEWEGYVITAISSG